MLIHNNRRKVKRAKNDTNKLRWRLRDPSLIPQNRKNAGTEIALPRLYSVGEGTQQNSFRSSFFFTNIK